MRILLSDAFLRARPHRAGARVIVHDSRKIVGWAMAPAMPAELVCTALQMALSLRRPAPGLLVHSDRGSQYASHAHTERLARHGAHASMSRKGKAGTTPSWKASS